MAFKEKIKLIKSNRTLKRAMKIIGYLITAVSVTYIGYVWYTNWTNIKDLPNLNSYWYWLIISAFFYMIISYLYPLGWKTILSAFKSNISFYNSIQIYGKSQIAKYIPGNVFHYVGRHIMSKKLGLNNGVIINGIFFEALSQIISAVIVGTIFSLILGFSKFNFLNLNYYIILLSVIIGAIIIFIVLIKTIPSFRSWINRNNIVTPIKHLRSKSSLLKLFIVILIHIIFFILLGIILWFIFYSIWGSASINLIILIGSFSIAWIIGFITPGASGGMGTREAILILMLAPYMGEAKALVLALLFRIITIIGDILFFSSTFIVKKAASNKITKA